MKESIFQTKLRHEIEIMLPGAIVIKTDPGDKQGIPDLIVLYEGMYYALEVKRHSGAPFQPNQQFYLGRLRYKGTHARVVYPENMEEVLNDIQRSLSTTRG